MAILNAIPDFAVTTITSGLKVDVASLILLVGGALISARGLSACLQSA